MTEAAEVEKKEDPDKEIRDAFNAAVQAKKTEDEVKLAMIGAGATFRNVTRMFNQFAIDADLMMSKDDRDELVEKVVTESDELTEEDSFNDAVESIVEAGTGIDESMAARALRAYCKKNDIEYWTKPKGEGGRSGFAKTFYDLLIANPAMTKEEAHDVIHGRNGQPETSDNVKNHESHYQGIREMANKIVEAKEAAKAA